MLKIPLLYLLYQLPYCFCIIDIGRRVGYTVESLLTDTPNKGHCIKYLSTMDKTKSPNINPPINIMQLESLKRGQSLYTVDKPLEFILVPKCLLFGDSTVLGIYIHIIIYLNVLTISIRQVHK